MAFIEAQGLVKRYFVRKAPPVEALAGVDLSVEQGTVRALLGPNGAGKTTAVKVFTTLLVPDEGTATIGGIDVVHRGEEVRPLIDEIEAEDRAAALAEACAQNRARRARPGRGVRDGRRAGCVRGGADAGCPGP